MNKQIKSLPVTSVFGDLPKLPFVRILSALDIRHDSLAKLPQAQINLVDTTTALPARQLLRFEDIKLDEYTDHGVAVTLLGAWIQKLVDGLNVETEGKYKLAAPNVDRPYMPEPAWRPNGSPPWGVQRFGEPFRSDWPNARPYGGGMMPQGFGGPSLMFSGYANPAEYQAAMVAQSLLRDISAASTDQVPSLSIVYTEGRDESYLRFEASLGHGVTFNANRVPSENEMGYVRFLEQVKDGGVMAGFFHVGGTKYLYTTGHRFGYHDETRSLLTQTAIGEAFNRLWAEHHKAMGLIALPVHFDEL